MGDVGVINHTIYVSNLNEKIKKPLLKKSLHRWACSDKSLLSFCGQSRDHHLVFSSSCEQRTCNTIHRELQADSKVAAVYL